MPGQPFISILVPCCNDENNGEEAVLAALVQCYPNVEVIAINDGSGCAPCR